MMVCRARANMSAVRLVVRHLVRLQRASNRDTSFKVPASYKLAALILNKS